MTSFDRVLNDYQLDLADLYRGCTSTVVVVAPERHGTTTALADIGTHQHHTRIVVKGRRARQRILISNRDLAVHRVSVHGRDRADDSTDNSTVVDCIDHGDVARYLTAVQTLVVLAPLYTVEEARMAPAFFGRVRQLTRVTAQTKRPVEAPREADNFSMFAEVLLDYADRTVYTCSFVVVSIHTFGATTIGDDPMDLLEWAADIGDDLITISTRYCFKPLDTVYITEPQRIVVVEAFSRACAVDWMRRQHLLVDNTLERSHRFGAPTQ